MSDSPSTTPNEIVNLVELAPRARRLDALAGLKPFLRPYRARIALAFVLLTLASAALLAVPLAFRDLVDQGFVRQATAQASANASAMNAHFALLLGIALFWAMTVSARYYLVSWLGERVTADLRAAIYSRVLRQSPQFFETLQTGEVLSRLTGDTTLVQTVVGSSVSMGLRSAFQFAGGMVMLAFTSFTLFAVNIGVLLLVVLPLLMASRRVRRLSRESQDRIADASAVASEMLNAATTVQANAQEPREAQRFEWLVHTSFAAAVRRTRMRAALTGAMIGGVFGAIVFVLWLGARAVAAGDMTAGQLASFVMYAGLVAGSAGVIAEVWGDLQRAAGATERLMELLRAQPGITDPARPLALAAPSRGAVRFERVSFRYPSRPGVAALDDVSFEVAAGETVALVGASGAGKTTVFQCLLRFYDVSDGRVTLDGVDVRQLKLSDLRGAIALVAQDPVIFSASALENIRYSRPDASDAEVHAVARAALADEFISRLPQGYDTFLGERGVRLSGGQRQRIAIARAMLRDAPLLLLDEATSALDAESERLVEQGLAAAMQGRTTLIIAHRLSTVRRADRVLVFDHGRIVEQGSPAELLGRDSRFARLARWQQTHQPTS
ncbi:MAG TPA: ABC transporter transmembrane domain-containing protein [Burkholderiaceae bacterium]|nr:ABC transporter transmembrane domain-containing protein [Burkholderiaceae bacterium]